MATDASPKTTSPAKGTDNLPGKPATTPVKANKERAAKPWQPCKCMTGTKTQCPGQTQGAFARGHDARMSSRVATGIAEGKLSMEDGLKLITTAGGGALLVGKTERSAKLRQGNAQAKVDRKTAKAAAAAAAKAETTPAESVPPGTKVKVQHGKRDFDAVVVRTASQDLMARHRFQGKDCDHELGETATA